MSNTYVWFTVSTMLLVYLFPMLMWERQLPFFMYVPFGIDRTNFGFSMAYLYQFGVIVYAADLNVAVNMYLFGVFVCVTFFLLLLSSRISRLGYSCGYNEERTKLPRFKKSFYREMCEIIELHLKIDR